jgi:DNA-binding HxlR family transcriptional regulator
MSIGANLDGTKDGYRHIPTAAMGRGLSHLRPLQPKHHSISERSQFSPQEQAAIRFALRLLQGKWKVGIFCRLQEGPARLGDLRRLFPQASKKMLTQHLREMELDGLIVRTDMSGKVPHVEYSLSNLRGQAVSRLLQILVTWSADYSEPPSDGISDRKAIFSASESDRQCDDSVYRSGTKG